MAVVAAILKSGLRIMPHSGGRVGKGIYFASENSKSAGYGEPSMSCTIILGFVVHKLTFPATVRCAGQIGIMFLNEVALGKEHHILRDDWTITAPPSGYDCVIAKGRTEPGV